MTEIIQYIFVLFIFLIYVITALSPFLAIILFVTAVIRLSAD
jgi:hypothetical protein